MHSHATALATSVAVALRPTGTPVTLGRLVLGLRPGRDPAGRHRVGRDAGSSEVHRDGSGQADHRRLRRGVGGLVPHGHHRTGHAGHVDDAPPPPRRDVRHRRAAHQERRVEVARHAGPPRRQAHGQQAARLSAASDADHARVVDHDVERTVRRDDLVDDPCDLRLVRQVGHVA